MKVLLVNPKFSGFEFSNHTACIPIGIAYIGSYLKEKGIDIKIVDYLTDSNADSHLANEINSSDMVGLSVMTSQIFHSLRLSEKIRAQDKDLPIVYGGVHPTLFPEQTILDGRVDFAVTDEGEKTMYELATALKKGKDLSKIRGLVYKKSGKMKYAGRRPYLSVEEIPKLDWSLFDRDLLNKLKPIPLHTSRGCPHRCKFCINPITKCHWRGMSAKRVMEDLDEALNIFKRKTVRFWDEDFFANPKRAREIIDQLIKQKVDIEWETTCRADYLNKPIVDDKLLSLAAKSGCYKLSFGAESGSQRILDMLTKDITTEDLVVSAKQCGKYGIISEYSFMIGLPGEEREDMNKTIDIISKLVAANKKTEIIGPQPFRPYPGSPLYEICEKSGWKGPSTLNEWAEKMEYEWNYLSPREFPWVKDPDFVESIWPFLNYALTPSSRLLDSGVKTNKLLKSLFIIASKVRWQLKFFDFPLEYKIGKMVMK